MSGTLILAATPIGNYLDASYRLVAEITAADVIAAEDTRRFRRLASDLNVTISAQLVSYFDGNEQSRTEQLIAEILAGKRVLMLTDAGMPSVSDPGYRLVLAAIAAGIAVTCLPGPSAVLTALAVSGLPVDRFCFEGFLARKPGAKAKHLAELAKETRTMVFFEAPHRTEATLLAMQTCFGSERLAVVCRELSKTYEQVKRGTLGELVAWVQAEAVRGEITIVVAGLEATTELTNVELASLVEGLVEQGMTRKAAVKQVAETTNTPKNQVYAAGLEAKSND